MLPALLATASSQRAGGWGHPPRPGGCPQGWRPWLWACPGPLNPDGSAPHADSGDKPGWRAKLPGVGLTYEDVQVVAAQRHVAYGAGGVGNPLPVPLAKPQASSSQRGVRYHSHQPHRLPQCPLQSRTGCAVSSTPVQSLKPSFQKYCPSLPPLGSDLR